MALLFFLCTLLFAFLALRGWPAEWSVWAQALIALVALAVGVSVLVLSAPSSKARRFKSSRGLRAWDRTVTGACLVLGLAVTYLILVFTPPAASRVSDYVVTLVRVGLMGDGASKNTKDGDADPGQASNNSDYDVGALFDPNGAVIPKTADLSPSRKPAVSLRLSSRAAAEQLRKSGQIYLHLFSHHAFDGERWTAPSPTVPLQRTPGPDGSIHLRDHDRSADYRYKVLHHELSSGLDALTTLQGALYVKLPKITELNSGTWLLPPPDNPLGIIRPYEAGSSPRRFRELLASGARIEPGDPGPGHLARSTDKNLNKLISEVAERFRDKPNLEMQMAAVQDWLNRSFVYSMQVDYPDKDKSALQSFLEHPGTSEGFCVHFASAAALILRELGVPSRISYGWTGGEYYPSHNQFVFHAENGHAWAEVFLKDQGWVVFETTPPTALPAGQTASQESVPPATNGLLDEDKDDADARDKAPELTWVVVAVGLGLVVLFVLLMLKRKRGVWRHSDLDADANHAPPDYLRSFQEACARLGHPKPAGLTLMQYCDRLARQGVTLALADELLTYHYNVTYREVARDARFEKQLCRRIKAL